jgi:FkbM family methyltransferase
MANQDLGNSLASLTQRKGWWVPTRDKISLEITLAEVHDLDLILPHCKQYRRVIQAGGQIGIWPMALAGKFRHVWTFEPDLNNYAALVQNTGNVANIVRTRMALGDKDGMGSMDHIDPENIGAHQVKEGEDFKIGTVDSYMFDDVDLIQLDIEGFEHQAILGAADTIDKCSPVIVLELKGLGKRYGYTDEETIEFLAGLGYKIKDRIHRDVLFVRA